MLDDYSNFLGRNKDLNEIEDNLWLGNEYAARNKEDLKRKGIKKILSVMDGAPNYNPEDGFIHKKIEIDDIIQYFGECLNFIKGEEKVFVHCAVGASRSATIVIAYLMWKNKKQFDEVLKLVQKLRPIVWPNDGFKDQLKLFEKLLEENNYDIEKINFKEVKWVPPENLSFY